MVYPKGVSVGESCSVVLMTYGGSWALLSSLDAGPWHGVALMLTSDVCEACRSVWQQSLLQTTSLPLLELLYWFSPVACLFNILGALAEEVPRAVSTGELDRDQSR